MDLKKKIEKLRSNPNFRHLRLDVAYTKQEEKEWEELIVREKLKQKNNPGSGSDS